MRSFSIRKSERRGAGESAASASRRRFWRSTRKYIWVRSADLGAFLQKSPRKGLSSQSYTRRACSRSARTRASVDLPTRSGPSMTMNLGACGPRWVLRARLAEDDSFAIGRFAATLLAHRRGRKYNRALGQRKETTAKRNVARPSGWQVCSGRGAKRKKARQVSPGLGRAPRPNNKLSVPASG